MIFLAAALYNEAKIFIEKFSLKRCSEINKFQVFKNEDIVLVITGTGGINAACACTYVISRFNVEKYDTFINVGICGSISKNVALGKTILVNKIMDGDSKKTFYPDILFEHPFLEGSIESFSGPVKYKQDVKADFVDMESAGFFQSVSKFIPPHRIYCIKIVSDYMENCKITGDDVKKLLRMASTSIVNWIMQLKNSAIRANNILDGRDMDYIEDTAASLKLSTTMKHELKKLSTNYKVLGGNLVLALEPFTQIMCESKQEGKIYFEQLKKQLEVL